MNRSFYCGHLSDCCGRRLLVCRQKEEPEETEAS